MANLYLILTWDICDTRLEGPYDSKEHAWSRIDDTRENYLEQVTVVGPLPEAARTPPIKTNNAARLMELEVNQSLELFNHELTSPRTAHNLANYVCRSTSRRFKVRKNSEGYVITRIF